MEREWKMKKKKLEGRVKLYDLKKKKRIKIFANLHNWFDIIKNVIINLFG